LEGICAGSLGDLARALAVGALRRLNFLAALAAEDADGRRSKRNLRRFLAGNAAMRKEEQLAAGSLFYVPDKTEV
jgi:hypothetical protein